MSAEDDHAPGVFRECSRCGRDIHGDEATACLAQGWACDRCLHDAFLAGEGDSTSGGAGDAFGLERIAAPWRRLWARLIDNGLRAIPVLFLAWLFSVETRLGGFGALIGGQICWVIVEAGMLQGSGATPGKWLVGLRVRTRTGAPLEFDSAYDRAASAAAGGGIGLLFLAPFLYARWYLRLSSGRRTSWDEEADTHVTWREEGLVRGSLAVTAVGAAVIFRLYVALRIRL